MNFYWNQYSVMSAYLRDPGVLFKHFHKIEKNVFLLFDVLRSFGWCISQVKNIFRYFTNSRIYLGFLPLDSEEVHFRWLKNNIANMRMTLWIISVWYFWRYFLKMFLTFSKSRLTIWSLSPAKPWSSLIWPWSSLINISYLRNWFSINLNCCWSTDWIIISESDQYC